MLTVLVTARQLGADGRGAIVLVVTVVSFASILCTLGLPVAARLRLVDTKGAVSLGDYLGLSVVVLLAEGAVTALVASTILPVMGVETDAELAGVVGLFAVLHGGLYLLVAALLAYGRLVTASFSDASGFLLQGGACVVAAVAGVDSITSYVAVLTVALIPPVLAALWSLGNLGHGLRPRADLARWKTLLRTGLPSIATVIGESATYRIDRLILGVFATPAAVGVYSVAATAAEILRFLPASASQVVFFETARGKMLPEQLRRVRRATLIGVASAGLVAAFAAPVAIRVTLGAEFDGAVNPLRILLFAELAGSVYILGSSVLSASDRVGLAARAASVGVLVVVAADLALIPPFASAGAAWASVLAYGAMALVSERLIRRTLGREGTSP